MYNTIRADIYRLFRGKMLYAAFILMLVVTAMPIVFVSAAYALFGGDPEIAQMLAAVLPGFNGSTAPFVTMTGASSLILYFAMIIVAVSGTEFTAGTAKNSITCGTSRVEFYFAKLILSESLGVILYVLCILFSILLGTALHGFGAALDATYVLKLLRPLLAQTFMMIAVMCVGTGLSFIFKKGVGFVGMYLSLFWIVPVVLVFIGAITEHYELSAQYSFLSNLTGLALIDTLPTKDIVRAFCVGGVYMVGGTALGLFVFRKSEVK